MYERAKRHVSRNTEVYQPFQLNIGPGAYRRVILTHGSAVTTAVKRVAGAPCVTEPEKKEFLQADIERKCEPVPAQQLLQEPGGKGER